MNNNKPGWHFDNSYARLPSWLFSYIKPTIVSAPKIILFNQELADTLSLDFSSYTTNELANICCGNDLPEGCEPIAQAYAGHQYGNFVILGDGRAILLGEHITPKKQRVDIQLKGCGRTPYSRQGDGQAVLGPMLREYIISEAMFALGIPTTRSLAVTSTGENVMRETLLPGAVLTRIAASHIRIGTFEYIVANHDHEILRKMVDYTLQRHYPHYEKSKNPAIALLEAVMEKQISLVCDWMHVGFIHGVMNTDNIAISGETIDYGPCAFVDNYDPATVFSSIDRYGRYAFGHQPRIMQWNLARFAETLLPLLHENLDAATQIATDIIETFPMLYQQQWLCMMRHKLGLWGEEKEDELLIDDLLSYMQTYQMDYTNTFIALMENDFSADKNFQNLKFQHWHQRWKNRLAQNSHSLETSIEMMHHYNPVVIPRNSIVEKVLQEAAKENLLPLKKFLEILKNPYQKNGAHLHEYQIPRELGYRYKTFCGT